MPEHNPGQMGGTMRLGKRRTLFQTKNSVMSKSCLPLAQPLAWHLQEACFGVVLSSGILGSVLALKFFFSLSYSCSFRMHCNVAVWVLERSQVVQAGFGGS